MLYEKRMRGKEREGKGRKGKRGDVLERQTLHTKPTSNVL